MAVAALVSNNEKEGGKPDGRRSAARHPPARWAIRHREAAGDSQQDMSIDIYQISAGIAVGMFAGRFVLCASHRRMTLYERYLHERIDSHLKDTIAAMSLKPKLILKGTGEEDCLGYHCSDCELEFPLAEHETPKQAMKDLYRQFKEHVEKHHPESIAGQAKSVAPTEH